MFAFLLAVLVMPTPLEMGSEPITREFELNQPYAQVVAKFWANREKISDELGKKVVSVKDPNTELVCNSVDGFYVERSQTVVMDMKRVGELSVRQSVSVKRGSIVIKEKLLGDHDYFSEYYVVVEIKRKGLGAVVSTKYWVDTHGVPSIIARATVRATAKKFERIVREVLEGPNDDKQLSVPLH